MTKVKRQFQNYAIGTSRSARTSVMLDRLMDEDRRRGIGERITALRERSPFTQQDMADKLGRTLRRYQQLEANGTTSHQRCEEIAAIHAEWTARTDDWDHADANWIWDGRLPQETPDLLGATQLAPLDQILDKLDAILTLLETAEADHADQQRRLTVIEELIRQRPSGGN
jgi:transcriptional regulator with XRE-family HTH domain